MISEAPIMSGSIPSERSARMPERITQQWRLILLCGDALTVLFVSLVALNGAGSRLAAAVLTAAAICTVFWQCGYYRRSYAVLPRDEAYYACTGVLFAALPIAIVLAGVAAVPMISIILTLLLSALGTAAFRVRAHLARRASGTRYAGIRSITARAWHDRESTWFLLAKRSFDVTVASIALVLASPIMIVAAAAITFEKEGPILFRQRRVGVGGRPFSIVKFRTMRSSSDGAWVRPGDQRITRLGALLRRTSIDELPQLINVLKGEMSIVGPRPEMVDFATQFAKEIPNYEQRHVVAPGITGWAQLYCKRNLQPADVPDVLPFDLFYVEHASVFLDCALLLKTATDVVFHGAV